MGNKNLLLIVVLIAFLTSPAFARNEIRLDSDVVNGRLIPTVVINGKSVTRIQDRGKRGLYESTFDRAEKIYATLVELEEKGQNLAKIRVRRFKSEYSANLKRARIFTISKGDILANDSSAYQLASLWVQNIRDATYPPEQELGTVMGPIEPVSGRYNQNNDKNLFPLLFLLNQFTKKGVIFFFFALLFILVVQVGVVFLVVQYFTKKQDEKDIFLETQLEKLQHTLSNQKQEIIDLADHIQEVKRSMAEKPVKVTVSSA